MKLEPGLRVTDNVRLVQLLGEGGMGSVWVADHLSLKTRVAVKFMAEDISNEDALLLERFNREAALSARIKSPHVVQIFDHGVMEGGRPYIVMELLEGESLAERLDRSHTLSLTHTALVVGQTAKALARAHKLGIVHRDIKPDNLFLSDEDDDHLFVKVLDFGIAKQTGSSAGTIPGTMVGTPAYMSPEQLLSARHVDPRADLWGLAAVAYHCLTGQVPFRGETLGGLCVAIASAEFEAPSFLRPELSPAVDGWFARALAKDPAERFASANDLATSLTLLLTGAIDDSPSLTGADGSRGYRPVLASDPGRTRAATDAALLATLPMTQPAAAASAPAGEPTFAGATMSQPGRAQPRRTALVVVGAGAALAAGATLIMTIATRPRHEPSLPREPEPPTSIAAAPAAENPGPTTSSSQAAATASAVALAPSAAPHSAPSGTPLGPRAPAPRPPPASDPEAVNRDHGF